MSTTRLHAFAALLLLSVLVAAGSARAEPELIRAFAFGSRDLSCANASGTGYTMVVQTSPDAIEYDGSRGWGYVVTNPGDTSRAGYGRFGPFDDSPNSRNAFGDNCPEELYDSFIGAKNFTTPCSGAGATAPCDPPEGIIFRVDVPNGTYRFVAAVGSADNVHTSRLVVEDGGSGGPASIGAHVVLVENHDQNVHGAGVFARVGFDGRLPPAASVNGFIDQPASPEIEVTNGYLRIHQLKGATTGTDPNGGNLVILELWRVDSAFEAITRSSTWRYFQGTVAPPATWRDRSFNDASWASGLSPFGYGDPPFGTDVNTLAPPMEDNYTSLFLRQSFSLTDPAGVDRLVARVDYDDGFAMWINGTEVLRINVPGSAGAPIPFNEVASSSHESGLDEDHELPDPSAYLVAGTNVVSVQVVNQSVGSSDLKFELSLFDPDAPDLSPPELVTVVPPPGVTVRSLTQISVTFDEDVTGVDAADLRVNGVAATARTGGGAGPYTFTFAPVAAGPANVTWRASHGIADLAGNPFVPGAFSYVVDPDAPIGDLVLNELVAANASGLADEDGDRGDWFEILNSGTTAVDLAGWAVSDRPTDSSQFVFPSRVLAPGEFLVVHATGKDRRPASGEIHTSFQLASTGETLSLFNPESPRQLVSQIVFPEQRSDVAYGRTGAGSLSYFETPTPGATNAFASAVSGFTGGPVAVPGRGFFTEAQTVRLSSVTTGAAIRYTLDGSEPTTTRGTVYSGPFTVGPGGGRGAVAVRAIAYRTNELLPSRVVTHTYVFPNSVMTQSSSPSGFPGTWNGQAADYQMDPDVVNDPGHTELVRDGLCAIPTLSIVSEVDGLFAASNGILANPSREGIAWERACSAELIYPDGRTGIQEDCGIRVQGGSSTGGWKVLKVSMRLVFKGDYGAQKLRFKPFRDSEVDRHNTLVLDAHLNQTWNHPSHDQRVKAQYCRDQLMSDLQNALGGYAPHDIFAHLYVNGLYWGVYDIHERPDAAWAEEYLGGFEEDYDVLRHTSSNVVDGSPAGPWNTMFSAARQNLAIDSNYLALAGHLDIVDFTDYMMANFWGGNDDWPHHNWYASRSRVEGLWRIHMWDAEHVMKSTSIDRTGLSNSIAEIYQNLRANEEYRLLFADRIHRAFFQGGPLYVNPSSPSWDPARPENNRPAEIYSRRIDEIDPAIACEAARWGDLRRPSDPYTRNDEWLTELGWLRNTYLPGRSATVLGQLRNRDLYPSVGAPVLNQDGGDVDPGFVVTLTRPAGTSGTIYYTLDDSDPRVFGTGAISASATAYTSGFSIQRPTVLKARVRSGTTWSALAVGEFRTPSLLEALVVSEILYNSPSGGAFEFLELENIGGVSLDLSGYAFVDGVQHVFAPGTVLGAGARLVLVSDAAAFASRYPGVSIDGVYTGSLANEGERLVLVDAFGKQVFAFSYNDRGAWPVSPDGFGFSLVRDDITRDAEDPRAWRASAFLHGSPGEADPAPVARDVVIHEILAASSPPFEDAIEIRNLSGETVDISGWYLSDDRTNLVTLKKYRIPDGVVLAPGAFAVFYENQFNAGGAQAFSLNSQGDDVYLSSADEFDDLSGYTVGISFRGSPSLTSFGHVETSAGPDLALLAATTFGADAPASLAQFRTGTGRPNAEPLIGPIVFHEIHFHPPEGVAEFIELRNIESTAVALFDATLGRAWEIAGISTESGTGRFEFPAGAEIPGNGLALVVPIDPEFFRARYRIAAAIPIFGPFGGALDNGGEELELLRPLSTSDGQPAFEVIERVVYQDRAPWPAEADGQGPSLERRDPLAYGNDPRNWGASELDGGTPAAANTVGPPLENQSPVARLSASPLTGPAPLVVSFDASASFDPDGPIARYVWDFDDGAVGSGRITSHAFAAQGSYRVVLRVEDAEGLFDEETVDIVVTAPQPNQAPVPRFIASPESGEAPLLVSFDASTSSDVDGTIVRYSWTFGDGGVASGRNVSHTYGSAGTFTARLTVEDDDGATAQTSRAITVTPDLPNRPPVAAFTLNPSSGPAPLLVTLDGSGSSDPDGTIVRYTWDFDDGGAGTGRVLNHRFQADGVYRVTLTVEDNEGATDVDTQTLTVGDTGPNESPVARFSVTPDRGEAPLVVTCDASASSDSDGQIITYEWLFGDGGFELGRVVEHTFTTPGEFAITLVVTDDDGATHLLERTVVVEDSAAGGGQVPGDCNQDGRLDVSDGICLLGHLFQGNPAFLPCGDGTVSHPANRALVNLNGDQGVDLSDAVYLLNYLFTGGRPPAAGTGCLPILGCPSRCP